MAGKADIVENLAYNLESMTKKEAAEAFDGVFEHIAQLLASGERVQVPGFGTFQISERAERQGRNPKTKEPMTIPASKTVRFKPGKQLKESVNS